MADYRLSHLASEKGPDYEDSFRTNPHRSVVWRIERQVLDHIVESYLNGTRFRLLDFACGTGRVLCHLEGRAAESTGIDVSPSMLGVARSKVRTSRIIEADITRADVLTGEIFDLITAFRFFPNAQADLRREALAALVTRLAPDGCLVFNNHKNSSSAVYLLAKLLGRKARGDVDMTTQEVLEMVAASGLKVVKQYHIGVLPVTEKHPVLPKTALYLCEKLLSSFVAVGRLARYHVYVCRRA